MRYFFLLTSPGEPNLALKDEPLGWDETRFTLKRDEKTHGVFFNFAAELRFICDSASYISRIYRQKGIESEIFIQIAISCAGETPTLAYYGRLDLSALKWYSFGAAVGCPIEDAGPQRLLYNRFSLDVDLLKDTTIENAPFSVPIPLTAVDNENGLTLRRQVIAEWNELTPWGQDLDGFPTNLGGAVCTTAPGKLGVLSCSDPDDIVDASTSQHALEYYFTPGWDDVLTEIEGFNRPILDFGNYTENECDGIGLQDDPERPPVLIKAVRAGAYHIETCICTRAVVWVSTDGRESCATGRTNDFESVKITAMATINNGAPFEITDVPQSFVSPNVESDTFSRCDAGTFTFLLPGDTPRFLDTTLCLNINTDINLEVGDELRIFVHCKVLGRWLRPDFGACICAFFYGCLTEVCCLKIIYDSQVTYSDTQIVGIAVNEAFGRITHSITENAVSFYSDYFGRTNGAPLATVADGCASRLFLTNGLNIRRFPTDALTLPGLDACGYQGPQTVQANFFCSLETLFDNLDCVYHLGAAVLPLGNNIVFRVEPAEWFYRDEMILEIDDLDEFESDFSRKVRQDLYFGAYEGGYARWESETINGLFEFNAPRTWRTPLLTVGNRLTRVCDFVASGYTWELTRRKPFNETGAADDTYDHEIFLLCTENITFDGVFYQTTPEIGVGPVADEILFPTECYNFRISPRANATRRLNAVGAGAFPAYTYPFFLFYNDGAGNARAQGSDPPAGLCNLPERREDAPVALSEARTPVFFVPEEVNFRYPIPFATYRALAANPYGTIRVNNEDFYLLELRFVPDNESEFRLLKKRV